jgi:hypothetical protein
MSLICPFGPRRRLDQGEQEFLRETGILIEDNGYSSSVEVIAFHLAERIMKLSPPSSIVKGLQADIARLFSKRQRDK